MHPSKTFPTSKITRRNLARSSTDRYLLDVDMAGGWIDNLVNLAATHHEYLSKNPYHSEPSGRKSFSKEAQK